MGSNKKQTRLLQKAKFEKLLAERKALLLGKGVIESKLKKDKVVKHLQAELNRAVSAIASIDAREKVIEKAKIKKQKNAEEKAVKPKSKKKKAETEPAEKGKGKEKKKKKKEK
ncbi:MAG: hypothetical protein KAR43_05670 [Deltaproteobacteria bacterium]|jgi:hypothetical protein|nr:hypothetical protein [Deltaproteobacteria bacterium]MBW2552960.1 hypothetical protein [Deltaproteobacteria bacterium]MCK5186605.1 hypothetical protein [Deltaproteobacteria bacterium]